MRLFKKKALTASGGADWLIVGLGNPGDEYAHTRHNAGFEAVDLLAGELGASYWKTECGALTAHVKHDGKEIILAKPQSFMNKSGGPVSKLAAEYGVPGDRIIIVHDELDIPLGSIRVKFGGGLAGHNGLRSVNEKLGGPDWHRVRVGIGRPPGRMSVTDWVLTAPRREASEDFVAGIQTASKAVLSLVDCGLTDTQQKFNRTA